MRIDETRECYTVLVTVDADDEDTFALLREHASTGLGRFKTYSGFLGGALHQSESGRQLVQYVQWRDEPSYRACMDDPSWARLPSAALALAAVHRGLARMEVQAYEVLRSVDADED